ncbi:MAG: Ig-like domain-containing protein, partial [Chloroflexota bacterium]
GWTGICMAELSNTCTVTLDQAQSVGATFTLNVYDLSVVLDGTGFGSVVSTSGEINCTSNDGSCGLMADHGTEIVLTATAEEGSTFEGWTGACPAEVGITCTVTLGQAQLVRATFSLNRYDLSVGLDGTGTGAVVSDVGDINCTSSDASCTAIANYGTTIVLTATADAGSIFVGWGGVCSGTGSCTLRMVEAKAVTATFDDVAEPVFPTDPLNEPPDGGKVETKQPTFEWKDAFDEGTSVVKYTVTVTQTGPLRTGDSTVWTFETTETSLTIDLDLSAGEYTWSVQAVDAAGNVSAKTADSLFTIEIEEGDDGPQRIFLPLVVNP